jgi:hypothetical protein
LQSNFPLAARLSIIGRRFKSNQETAPSQWAILSRVCFEKAKNYCLSRGEAKRQRTKTIMIMPNGYIKAIGLVMSAKYFWPVKMRSAPLLKMPQGTTTPLGYLKWNAEWSGQRRNRRLAGVVFVLSVSSFCDCEMR